MRAYKLALARSAAPRQSAAAALATPILKGLSRARGAAPPCPPHRAATAPRFIANTLLNVCRASMAGYTEGLNIKRERARGPQVSRTLSGSGNLPNSGVNGSPSVDAARQSECRYGPESCVLM